jgi:hypothetical protein
MGVHRGEESALDCTWLHDESVGVVEDALGAIGCCPGI